MTPAAPDRFDACAAAVIAARGPFLPHDPVFEGPSAHGIGLGLLSVWVGGPADETALRRLGADGAARILRQMVWAPLDADHLAAGPDLALFAYAAEAGTMQALTDLQMELGVAPTGAPDAATVATAAAREPALLARAIRRRHEAWRHARGLERHETTMRPAC
ncbi:hypothetical protein GWK16_23355 [Roseomonas sp. JC162]|uniref:Uncharacterized protein n=1 Tax=Neoroseomonas marina TaxID=1232220 RepID=A0A848EHT2_9PROT|nr:hypothetical protein [Neoroseomonas marina]NMJ44204.1 hypothetical protein [Neoroseomonas marina]